MSLQGLNPNRAGREWREIYRHLRTIYPETSDTLAPALELQSKALNNYLLLASVRNDGGNRDATAKRQTHRVITHGYWNDPGVSAWIPRRQNWREGGQAAYVRDAGGSDPPRGRSLTRGGRPKTSRAPSIRK